MVGRRVNSFVVEALGYHTSSALTGVGGLVTGFQIPSVAYPLSLAVSRFNQITFLSYLNDWLIADGVVLFVYLFQCFLPVNGDLSMPLDYRHELFGLFFIDY